MSEFTELLVHEGMVIVIFIHYQCYPQVLFDVLWVRQLGLCVAVAAQDAKLETAIQVLPLVSWIVYRASSVQFSLVQFSSV